MLVGSKVRMLHGTGEGIVTKINGNQLIVLLNEGLEIPMNKGDVVEVAHRSETNLEKPVAEEKPAMLRSRPSMFFVKEGVYLAGTRKSPMLAEMNLVNYTDFHVFVAIYRLAKPVHQFMETLQLQPKSVELLKDSVPLSETHHWIGLGFQILKFHPDQGDAPAMKEFRISFSQLNWKQETKIPILEKMGMLLQLDGEEINLQPEKIKEAMMSHRPVLNPPSEKKAPRIFSREVDLHIENLIADSGSLAAGEMREIQLETFEKAMDKAILDQVETLIIIHGVGAGVLKEEIHRRLGKRRDIQFFKEGNRDKYGFGATEIKIF